jgi:hypothetical protein
MPIRPENRHFYAAPEFVALRETLRRRSRNRCERCGADNGARGFFRLRVRGVILTVAHLDHDPRHRDPKRCAYLCQCCHLAHDARNNYARRRRHVATARGQLWLDRAIEIAATPEVCA